MVQYKKDGQFKMCMGMGIRSNFTFWTSLCSHSRGSPMEMYKRVTKYVVIAQLYSLDDNTDDEDDDDREDDNQLSIRTALCCEGLLITQTPVLPRVNVLSRSTAQSRASF